MKKNKGVVLGSFVAGVLLALMFSLISGSLPDFSAFPASGSTLDKLGWGVSEVLLLLIKAGILAYILAVARTAWRDAEDGVGASELIRDGIEARLRTSGLVGGSAAASAGETAFPFLIHESYDGESERAMLVSDVIDNLDNEIAESKDPLNKQAALTIVSVCRSFHVGQSIEAAENALRHQKSDIEAYVGQYFQRLMTAKGSLPMIGFAGTIIGIMISMGALSAMLSSGMEPEDMKPVIRSLGVAFDTTLIALIATYILGRFATSRVREAEDNIDRVVYEIEKQLITRFKLWLHPEHIQNMVKHITQDVVDEVRRQMARGIWPGGGGPDEERT